MLETVLIFLSGSGVLGLIFWAAVWLVKESTKKLLESELERHKNTLSQELELYKREIDLEFQKKLNLQNRRHELFEQFSTSIENMFGKDDGDLSLELNKLYGLLALYAPDDVYLSIKNTLEGQAVRAQDAKPIIYAALRNNLFGTNTNLAVADFHKHVVASHVDKA